MLSPVLLDKRCSCLFHKRFPTASDYLQEYSVTGRQERALHFLLTYVITSASYSLHPQITSVVSLFASNMASSVPVGDHAAGQYPECVVEGEVSSKFPKSRSPVSEATTKRCFVETLSMRGTIDSAFHPGSSCLLCTSHTTTCPLMKATANRVLSGVHARLWTNWFDTVSCNCIL